MDPRVQALVLKPYELKRIPKQAKRRKRRVEHSELVKFIIELEKTQNPFNQGTEKKII